MEISKRLMTIIKLVEKCEVIADIGTDHGYLPIRLITDGLCNKAIASDINEKPLKKAELNISIHALQEKIECRLGGGLNILKPNEVDCAIIAGMGGNLIRDILKENIEVFKSLDNIILQPVQNSEVLREYLYKAGHDIVDEELCLEDNIYYEIIKVRYNDESIEKDKIFYEISEQLIKKKHPLISDFIKNKIYKYKKILGFITDKGENAISRKFELECKLKKLEELLDEFESE